LYVRKESQVTKSRTSPKSAAKRAKGAAGTKTPRIHPTQALKPAGRGSRREGRVRKEFWLTPGKLDEAKRVLGTSTDVDTVEEALDLVVFRDEVRQGVRMLGGLGLSRVD
jgi:hypothetical protein